jgi:hypothetical protein
MVPWDGIYILWYDGIYVLLAVEVTQFTPSHMENGN